MTTHNVDPFFPAARVVLAEALNELSASVAGLDAEALNRRPGGDGTNSIAVLVVHALTSTRWWLSVATGAQLPDRVRDDEFRAVAASGDELRAFVLRVGGDCQALLAGDGRIDWSAMRAIEGEESVVASFALLHGLSHLREHVGQIGVRG